MKRVFILLSLLFCATAVAHTVTWYDNNVVVRTDTCDYGDYLNPPTPTSKYGYTFSHWEARSLYTPVEYIETPGHLYVDTGIVPDVDNIEFEISFRAVTGSNYLFQSRETQGSGINGVSGANSGSTIALTYMGKTLTSGLSRVAGNDYFIRATLNNGVSTLYVENRTTGETNTVTGTYNFNANNLNSVPICLFGNTAGNTIKQGVRIYYAKMKINNSLVMDYTPVKRNTDNKAGFLDSVSGAFKVGSSISYFLMAGPEL